MPDARRVCCYVTSNMLSCSVQNGSNLNSMKAALSLLHLLLKAFPHTDSETYKGKLLLMLKICKI